MLKPLLAAALLVSPALARSPIRPAASWSAAQATGAPNVPRAGDHVSAWASQAANGGIEWLDLSYAKAVKIAKVRIRETYNPGAVTRVTAFVDGGEVTVWEGRDRTRKAPAFLEIKPSASVKSDRVRVYLDTRKVAGWNEIDAVELVGADGRGQWARGAAASSSYGQAMGLANLLDEVVGRDVSIRMVHTWVATGRVTDVRGDWIRLEVQGRTRLVNRAHVVDIEFK